MFQQSALVIYLVASNHSSSFIEGTLKYLVLEDSSDIFCGLGDAFWILTYVFVGEQAKMKHKLQTHTNLRSEDFEHFERSNKPSVWMSL